MKTKEQINNINVAPNKTIKLSLAASRELFKNNVESILQSSNIGLEQFGKNELKTLQLGEMFGISKEKLGFLTLKETLNEVGIDKYQVANNYDYTGKTVPLAGLKAA